MYMYHECKLASFAYCIWFKTMIHICHQPSFFRYSKFSLSCATSSSSVYTRLLCSPILTFCMVTFQLIKHNCTTQLPSLTLTVGNLDWRNCSLCCLLAFSSLHASVCWFNISILCKFITKQSTNNECKHMHAYMCVQTHAQAHTHSHIRTCIHAHTCMHTRMYAPCVHTHVRARAHTHTHTHTNVQQRIIYQNRHN